MLIYLLFVFDLWNELFFCKKNESKEKGGSFQSIIFIFSTFVSIKFFVATFPAENGKKEIQTSGADQS